MLFLGLTNLKREWNTTVELGKKEKKREFTFGTLQQVPQTSESDQIVVQFDPTIHMKKNQARSRQKN